MTRKLWFGQQSIGPHPSLLDHLRVDYYGAEMPISQVANIGVEDARTLTVTPWEKQMVQAIEKSILKSDLGLNPNTAGSVMRVPMPPLTEERRRDLIRVVKQEMEGARVAIRNIRRESIRSGLIPIINSMAATGVVSLPGMMTGQILGGTPPVEAVKYQILIMFLIAAGTGFGVVSAIWMSRFLIFDKRHRLRLDILKDEEY